MSLIRTAPAPTRTTSSVILSAGLINIPLGVYTATEPTTVHRKEFLFSDPEVSVGRAPIRKDTDEVISTGQIIRMAQAESGAWVKLTDEEVASIVGASGSCEVVSFIPTKDAGCYLTDGLYQVRPKDEKRGGAAAKAAFALLLAGMTARKVNALVRITMRGTPRYALLTPDGDLLMIATADSIREPMPLPDHKPSKAEVAMVCTLIDAIGIDTPTVVDDISPKVQAFVNDKAVRDNVALPEAAPKPVVVDLTAALAASIDAAKAAKKTARPKTKVA
jgi:DNA end-binding protein Ku